MMSHCINIDLYSDIYYYTVVELFATVSKQCGKHSVALADDSRNKWF